jgi:hypothetical protein
MPSRQGIETDQLINVIQVLQLGRKTGELQAERHIGSRREEGTLKFVYGQITFAQCGELDEKAALHWLQSWGQCRFTFTNAVEKKETGPLLYNRQPSSELPTIQRQISAQLPAQHIPAQQYSPGQQYSPRTDPISAYATVVPHRMYAVDEGMYRLKQANISRLHRHLYLLIDGQRSCAELVRLVNRQPEDLIQLLHDLERVGIVQLN